MLYKEIPFTGYCIFLALGIISAEYIQSGLFPVLVYLILFAILLILAFFHKSKNTLTVFGLIVHCCIFISGFITSKSQSNRYPQLKDEYREFIIRAEDYPVQKSNSLMIDARMYYPEAKLSHSGQKIRLYTGKEYLPDSIKPGDIISYSAIPVEITDYDTTDNFDYSVFMKRKGYRYFTFCYDSISIYGRNRNLKNLGLILRMKLFNSLRENISDDQCLSIVSAMSLGYRDIMDDELKERFRQSGIIHIIAVSGLHVGIISLIVIALLKISGIRSGPVKLIISLLIIWLYALITGLSPSVRRAAIMFSFLNTGYYMYRPVKPINSVMASAFLLLIINPFMLFEASFLLSYSAVISIVLFYDPLQSIIRIRGRISGYFWKMTVVSFLAQAGTLPFVILFFTDIPLFSLLTNLIAIPLATLILAGGFLILASSALPLLPGILEKLINYFADCLSDLTLLISSIENSTVSTAQISPVRAVLLFLIIILSLRFILSREGNNPHIVLTIFILYFIAP